MLVESSLRLVLRRCLQRAGVLLFYSVPFLQKIFEAFVNLLDRSVVPADVLVVTSEIEVVVRMNFSGEMLPRHISLSQSSWRFVASIVVEKRV